MQHCQVNHTSPAAYASVSHKLHAVDETLQRRAVRQLPEDRTRTSPASARYAIATVASCAFAWRALDRRQLVRAEIKRNILTVLWSLRSVTLVGGCQRLVQLAPEQVYFLLQGLCLLGLCQHGPLHAFALSCQCGSAFLV